MTHLCSRHRSAFDIVSAQAGIRTAVGATLTICRAGPSSGHALQHASAGRADLIAAAVGVQFQVIRSYQSIQRCL